MNFISHGCLWSAYRRCAVSANAKVSISNCTFYNWATKQVVVYGNWQFLPKAVCSISCYLLMLVSFGYSAGKALLRDKSKSDGKE